MLAIAASTVGLHGAVSNKDESFNCATSMLDSCLRCYDERELEVTWMDGVDRNAALVMRAVILTSVDPLVQCRKPELYKEAFACVLDVLEACSRPAQPVIRLPDRQRMLAGMDLMCSKYYTANAQCLKEQDSRILNCGTELSANLLHTVDPEILSNTPIVCLAYEVNYDCMEKILGEACDAFTAKAYLDIARKYTVPRVCLTPETDPGREDRIRHIRFPSKDSSKAPVSTVPCVAVISLGLVMSWSFASFLLDG